jgi:hypothetical protein
VARVEKAIWAAALAQAKGETPGEKLRATDEGAGAEG